MIDDCIKKEKKDVTFLVDMDCILVNMLPHWLDVYSRLTGDVVDVNNVADWDLEKQLKMPKVAWSILNQPGFFCHKNMYPMPEATQYFEMLYKNYNVLIVTQAPVSSDFAVRDKKKWIKNWFPDFNLRKMIFCHEKHAVDGDVIIDDKPEHLIEWKSKRPYGITATIDWKYNQDVNVDIRAKDWSELYGKIEEIFS